MVLRSSVRRDHPAPKLRAWPEQCELQNVSDSFSVLTTSPRGYRPGETAPHPPGRILAGKVEGHFVGADALGFPDAICCAETTFLKIRARFETGHVLHVQFAAEWTGFGIEGLDFVLCAPAKLGIDRGAGWNCRRRH